MNLVSEERDCGCLLGNNTVTKEVFISYCPKHAAAPDMFEALKELEDTVYPSKFKKARAALELAGGSDD